MSRNYKKTRIINLFIIFVFALTWVQLNPSLLNRVYAEGSPQGDFEFKQYGTFKDYDKYLVTDNAVYVYKGSTLSKLNLNGDIIWQSNLNQGDFVGEIFIQKDSIYTGVKTGYLYITSTKDGSVLKTVKLPSNATQYFKTAFIASNGEIYVIADALYCFFASGIYKWRSETTGGLIKFVGDKYLIADKNGDAVWMDITYGSSIDSADFYDFTVSNDGKVYGSRYFVGSYELAMYNEDAEFVWSLDLGHVGSYHSVSPDSSTVYVGVNRGPFYVVDTKLRKVKWKFDQGNPVWGRAVTDKEGNIYVTQDNPEAGISYLYQFSSNGEVLGVNELPAFGAELHMRSNGTLYFVSDDTLYSTKLSKQVNVSAVELDKSKLELAVGAAAAALKATIQPSDATNQNVTWSSSNPSVATVDGSGKVTPVSAGTAVITVTTEDGKKTATATVTVKDKVVSPTGVTLNTSSLNFTVGDSPITLQSTVLPANATNKNVTWSSSNPSIATVDGSGKVTPISAGTAVITVTTEDGKKTATCTVTVTEAVTDGVDHLEASEPTIHLLPGGFLKFQIYAVMRDGKEVDITRSQDVTYRVNPSSMATVKAGVVQAGKKTGTATITVNYQGKTIQIPVTISSPVDSLETSTDFLRLDVHTTKQVQVIAKLSDGTRKDVTEDALWTTDDNTVATVEAGEIEGIAAGLAGITVSYGGKTVSIPVLVENPPAIKRLEISEKNLQMAKGEETELSVWAVYDNEEREEVTEGIVWQSSKKSVIDVRDGVLTALQTGKATITASYKGKKATLNVSAIEKKVKSLAVSKKIVTLAPGKEAQLKLMAFYTDGTKTDATTEAIWTTKRDSIATVEDGLVKAKGKGTTTLTVKYGAGVQIVTVVVK